MTHSVLPVICFLTDMAIELPPAEFHNSLKTMPKNTDLIKSGLSSFIRHRYAKNFLEKYNDIALLADLMGHESIETTRIYLRRTASEQQELVNKIVTW